MESKEVIVRKEDAEIISEIMEGINQPTSVATVVNILRENYPHKTPENIARARKVRMLNEKLVQIRREAEDNYLSEIARFKNRCICEGVPDIAI